MSETQDLQAGRFAGRTVIVTGAGSGIGRATAERLAREGARVVATDVVPSRLDELAAALGAPLATIAGDITDPATIERVVATAGDRIDGLANVAGVMDGFLPTAEIDDATWERVLSVNLTAMMRLTRAVLPKMLHEGRGSIVNVGSEAGLRASCAGTAYTTSKHAVHGFTRSTAFFYSPKGIRCNVVAPGGVATNLKVSWDSPWGQERLGPILQATGSSMASPEQIAAAITWLLSDDSANVSGAVLADDGGWSAI